MPKCTILQLLKLWMKMLYIFSFLVTHYYNFLLTNLFNFSLSSYIQSKIAYNLKQFLLVVQKFRSPFLQMSILTSAPDGIRISNIRLNDVRIYV